VEGLLDFNGPNRSLSQHGPFDLRAPDVSDVVHRRHASEAILEKRSNLVLNVPLTDGCDFKRRTKSVNEQADRTPVVHPTEQFDDRPRGSIFARSVRKRTVPSADHAHSPVHRHTPCYLEAWTPLEPICDGIWGVG